MTFNATEFLQQSTSEALSTKYKPIPPGTYPAFVESLAAKQQNDRQDPTKVYTILDVIFSIESPAVKEALGLTKVTARQSLFLEMTELNKVDFSPDKNIPLGRLREATGTNVAGQLFSFSDLIGKPVIVTIINEPDKDDPETIWSRVKRVGKVA